MDEDSLTTTTNIFSIYFNGKKKIMVVIPGLVIDLKRRIGHSITGSTSKSHGSIYELWVRNIASEIF